MYEYSWELRGGICSFPRPDLASAPNGSKPPWPEEFGVEVVTLQPGEALVFTESLMHSTALYSGRGQRRTLFCTRQQALALFGSVGTLQGFLLAGLGWL